MDAINLLAWVGVAALLVGFFKIVDWLARKYPDDDPQDG
jgi:hypothetical protein